MASNPEGVTSLQKMARACMHNIIKCDHINMYFMNSSIQYKNLTYIYMCVCIYIYTLFHFITCTYLYGDITVSNIFHICTRSPRPARGAAAWLPYPQTCAGGFVGSHGDILGDIMGKSSINGIQWDKNGRYETTINPMWVCLNMGIQSSTKEIS